MLVTHNSDESVPSSDPRSRALLHSPLLIAWLAENADSFQLHPKFISVPIGLQNQQWGRSGVIGKLEGFLRRAAPVYDPGIPSSNHSRPILMYVNFSPHHHPLRKKALDTFKGIGTFQERDRDRLEDYWEKVLHSKFVLSPPGELLQQRNLKTPNRRIKKLEK